MSAQQKPVAWAVIGDDYEYATLPGEHACAVAEEEGGMVVSLYRHPPCQDFPQKNLTLTDAEREAVEASRDFWEVEAEAFSEPKDQQYAATLRGLLERTGGGR